MFSDNDLKWYLFSAAIFVCVNNAVKRIHFMLDMHYLSLGSLKFMNIHVYEFSNISCFASDYPLTGYSYMLYMS